MQTFAILATLSALFAGTNAAALRRNVHVSDFRIFGETGCYEENIGIWTVIDDDLYPGFCSGFNADVVKSVNLYNLNEGCEMYIYSGENCSGTQHAVAVKECADADLEWKSWSMQCASSDE